jgi:phosphopantothenoylcysteine synthetase/decarboxylase
VIVVGPDRGRVACGEGGVGRLAAVEDILTAVLAAIPPPAR